MRLVQSQVFIAALALLAGCAVAPVAAIGGVLEVIAARGSLRVCVWPDYYGISYRDPRSRELSGIDIDMARALARDLGVGVDFVESSFAKLIEDVTGENCDVAMFAVGVTAERARFLRFTQPHLASDIYAIASKANERILRFEDIDRPGTVVAVAKGTLHEAVMRAALKRAELLVLDTPFGREQEVRAGRADVFMTDYPYSQRFLASNDWGRLIAPAAPFHITPYAYAVRLGDDAWFQRVDGFVTAVKADGRLANAAARHGLSAILVP